MKYITYFIKFFYRIRYWLIFAPLLIAALVYWKTKHMPEQYTTTSSIYTGIITGVNILSESGVTTTSYTQSSMMDNLLNIITADQTLKQVSLRLYARIMVHGDPDKDNTYVKAHNYRTLYNHGAPIHHLIYKNSTNDSINEQRTYENLVAYETNDNSNYVYGIYQWNLPYVNRESLQRIFVERVGNSDIIEITYSTDDPGITYQTVRILIDEFIKQYQELRFGETNNVIAYFQAELKRIGEELKASEDSLTKFRIAKRVINYEEETKSIAGLNSDYNVKYWEASQIHAAADSLKSELERRMKLNTEIIQNNNTYILYNKKITELSEKLAVAKFYSQAALPQTTIDSLNQELQQYEKALAEAMQKMGYLKYSKEGISNLSVIEEWLAQVIASKKSEAELKVLQERRAELDRTYVHFAPIGSTQSRKEREININERRYITTLDALNAAILRQKSLQMTSSTLKPMNDPYYPLKPSVASHRNITYMAYLAALLFTIFFFLVIEVIDRTLHHIFKAEQLTGSRVMGVFTRPLNLRARRYNQVYVDISAKTLCNYAITYFNPGRSNIINLISNEPREGKSYIMQQMTQQFTEQGIEVTQLSWHEEYQGDAQAFIQALDLDKFDLTLKADQKDKVFLVEYPSLKEAALTSNILQGANLNLQIVNSQRTWKNTDQQQFQRTREMCGKAPLFLVLNYANRDAAEEINGLMPPYSFFRKLFYRFSQLGLTAKEQHSDV